MQAILIKLILIIFGYINLLISDLILLRNLESIIFIATLTTVTFTIIQCLRGIEPDLPGISSATKMQI